MKKKIGIMGGTFDPIHNGHLIIAQNALVSCDLDEVWFMPAGDPPHKGNDVTAKEHRINMVSLAIEENKDFSLFTYEADKERPSYSAITFCELHDIYPDFDFFFIMGADSFLNFKKWYHPEMICRYTSLVVGSRDNTGKDSLQEMKNEVEADYGARVILLYTPQIEISSSDIRSETNIKNIRYLVPEKVYNYIKNNNLYALSLE